MPKQPVERRRKRNQTARQPTNSDQFKSNSRPASNSSANPLLDQIEALNSKFEMPASKSSDFFKSNRRAYDLDRLTRSPLVPGALRFMSQHLMLRGIALGTLLFSFIGALAVCSQLSLLKLMVYGALLGTFALALIYSSEEHAPENGPLISLLAVGIETIVTVLGIVVMGFSAPMYFTILPFYIVVGHIQAAFPTRAALGLTALVWLGFLGVMLSSDEPVIKSAFIVMLLMLSIPFFMVTLVVRFVVREGEQRQRLVEALEELTISEERYRQVTDRANDAIYIVNSSGNFTFVNHKLTEIVGYTEDELLGRHFTDVLRPENRQVVANALREAAQPAAISKSSNRKQSSNPTTISLEVIRKDGQQALLEVTVAALTNSQGKLTGWVGIARDVTERTRMREQVERRNRDLTALNAVISTAGQSLELDKLLNDVVTTLVNVLRADVAGITLIEEETRLLKVGAYKGLSDTVVRAVTNASIEESESLTREVATTGKPILIEDMTQDLRVRAMAGSAVQAMGLHSFAAAPLKARDKLLGVVSLISHSAGAFHKDDLDLLVSIGQSLAVAIENARLYGTSLNQVREMTCLAEIARAINLSESLDQTLTNIANSISAILGYKACAVSLVDRDELFIRSYGAAGMPAGFLDRINQLAQDSSLTREELLKLPLFRSLDAEGPVVYQISVMDGNLTMISQLAVAQNWSTVLTVPFHIQGQPKGVISCYSVDSTPPPDSELRLLMTIANQTSLAVQNAELFREQQRRADQLRAVGEIGRKIGSILSMDELLPFITGLLQQTFDYYIVSILLIDPDRPREMILQASHCWNPKMVTLGTRMNIDTHDSLVAWVANHGEPAIIPNVSLEPRYAEYGEPGLVKSEMVVPIKRGQQVIGVIDVASTLLNGFDDTDLATMQALAEQVSIALENARLYTQVNRVVIQLTNANVELEEATRHKSEFLANMSHELRTPLNAIIGFSEVLLDELFGGLNDKQKRYANNILTSGRHLLTLVNDVLDLAKVEAGRMELYPEDFNPDEAIQDVESIISVSANKKGLIVQNRFEAKLASVKADKSKFKQVLYNLLSNAVKFTPESGKILVGNHLHTENGQDYLAIWVKDTGIGIRREDHLRIFEEFRQVDSSYSRQHQGTGLGLALSKRLIELHGGRIWVESEPGVGSIFTFILPLNPVTAQTAVISPAPAEPIDRLLEAQVQNRLEKQLRSGTGPLDSDKITQTELANSNGVFSSDRRPEPAGPLVLVVEDDDRAAEILMLYLQEGGYRVARARNGSEAVEKANELKPRPSLITLDVLLPGVSGWEILRNLKAHQKTRSIPVLVITLANDLKEAYAAGAFGVIPKPVTREVLLDMVSQALAEKVFTP
ncbi:MAG TPA: GAF domain-containing protein [Chloroflexia bacterium]|nr:GAF domain-containing protein [Chloroflexia bacterium]